MIEKLHHSAEKLILTVIAVGFIAWSIAFIYGSAVVSIDGRRYFSLVDDGMVSMRYAWNLSHGFGLVWNPGERVEGYSNLLMVLVMSLATAIFDKTTAVLSIQVLGIGLALANAYVTMRIVEHLVKNEAPKYATLVRVISFFVVLAYYPATYWALLGMETGLVTLFLLLGVLSSIDYVERRLPSRLILSSLCLGLAFLTRNDSSIFAALIFTYILVEAYRFKLLRQIWLRIATAIAIFLLFVVGQTIFRWTYYGELLPNTYALKLGGVPILSRFKDGMLFIAPFLRESSFLFVVASMDLLFNFQIKRLFLFSIAVIAIVYQVLIGGDVWNYWRFLSPAMPLVLVLFVCGLVALVDALSKTAIFQTYFLRNPIVPKRYVFEFLLILLALIGIVSADMRFAPEIVLLRRPTQAPPWINAAVALNDVLTENATVGVFVAGIVPYYTGRVAVDFLGKSDKYIAQLPPDLSGDISWEGVRNAPGHTKYDLDYSIKTLRPTYVEGFVWGKDDLSAWAESTYIKVDYKGVPLFLLRDSPAVRWDRISVR